MVDYFVRMCARTHMRDTLYTLAEKTQLSPPERCFLIALKYTLV